MILLDSAEPEDIENLLKQSAPIARMNLNSTHRSDYYFAGVDFKTRQFSRKQSGELLSNLDEAEDQIRSYYENADENNQIVEGIISPVPITRKHNKLDMISVRHFDSAHHLFSYKVAANGYIFGEQAHSISAPEYFAWIYRLDQCGVSTYYTINYVDTAKLLIAIYNNCQKPEEEHTTLQRIIRPRIITRSPNPFIRALMSLSVVYKIGVGEDKATKIAAKYSSLFDLAMAEIKELTEIEGIGKRTAEKILAALGKDF